MKVSRLLTVIPLSLVMLLIWPAPASATIYGFDFEPKAGGPGTQVHAHGNVPPIEVTIELGIAHDINAAFPDRRRDQFEPIAVLGKIQAVAYQSGGAEAGLNTTVVIPSHKVDGNPITERDLAIRVVDKDGNQIYQTPARVFSFTPSPLPATGSDNLTSILAAIAASLSLVLAGWLLSRQEAASLH